MHYEKGIQALPFYIHPKVSCLEIVAMPIKAMPTCPELFGHAPPLCNSLKCEKSGTLFRSITLRGIHKLRCQKWFSDPSLYLRVDHFDKVSY